MIRRVSGALGLGLLLGPLGLGAQPNSTLPTLTELRQVIDLSIENARRHHPVEIRAVVTHADASFGVFFVHDGTAGIFVNRLRLAADTKPGDLLLLKGRTAAGQFTPFLDAPVAEKLGHTNLPPTRRISLEQLSSGACDAQWVELETIVQAEEEMSDHLLLRLGGGKQRLKAWVQSYAGYRNLQLTDARVRFRGVVGASYDRAKQIIGFQLYVTSLTDVSIVEPPPYAPFAGPVLSSRELATFPGRKEAGHRLRTQGAVTGHWPGRCIFLKDHLGGICIQTRQTNQFRLGDWLDVCGFPVHGSFRPELQDCIMRSLGSNSSATPVPIGPREVLTTKHNFDLVQTEAELLHAQSGSSGLVTLVTRVGPQTVTVRLPRTTNAFTPAALPPGSQVRLTGVCTSDQSDEAADPNVTLLLRSGSDLEVLARPPTGRRPGVWWPVLTTALLVVTLLGSFLYRWQTRQVAAVRAHAERELHDSAQQFRRSLVEREQIARDLHDNIIQSIYAIGLGLEECGRSLVAVAPDAGERLKTAVGALNAVIRDVRQFIGGLEPKLLSGHELKTALKSLALTAGEAGPQFTIQVDAATASHLTSQEATHLLHIAKEAMSNSLRHAKARSAVVALQTADGTVRLEIRDDGAGFNSQINTPGHGLRNMAARAREIGAQLRVISTPDQGTRIVVDLAKAPAS